MKIKHPIIIVGLLVVVAALISVAVITHRQHLESVGRLQKLASAVQSYSRDQISHGQPVPSSVTLRDLATSGYISAESVRDFGGLDVTLYPTTNDADPQSILIRVRMPDGNQIAAMGDGSIQQLTK